MTNLAPEVRLPQVSFDIRLGKKYNLVDFDYEAYIEHLQDCGLTSDDIESTQIYIRSSRLPAINPGLFTSPPPLITLAAGKKANRALIHETQHRIDSATKAVPIGYNSPELKLIGFSGVSGGAVAAEVIAFAEDYPAEVHASIVGILICAIGGLAYTGYKYANRPAERRARAAEKNVHDTFLVLER
jgi:hypothetical protein